MVWEEGGARIADAEQVVLEAQPHRRLSYTWHTPTAEWATRAGITDDVLATLAAERRSKVTFEIEPLDGQVKLTVVHDGFEPDSTMLSMVSQGWPHLLSALKTLLETGEPLPDPQPAG